MTDTPPVPDAYRAPAGNPAAVLDRIRDARRWSDIQAQLGMYYGWTAEQSGLRARAYRTAEQREADLAEKHAERNAADARNEAARADRAELSARQWQEEAELRDRNAAIHRKRAEKAEQRLELAHQARRAKVAQLDEIKRAMLDTGLMREGDPYSHADLADVIRQVGEGDQPLEGARDDYRQRFQNQMHAATELVAKLQVAEEDRQALRRDYMQARDAVDRVRNLAADIRTWCSPRGIASQYADDIEKALDSKQDAPATTASPSIGTHTYEGDGGPCTTEAYGMRCNGARDSHQLINDDTMTVEEARDAVDDLSLQLYRSEDARAWVRELCDIRDREQQALPGEGTVTTGEVVTWLEGPKCGRQIAAASVARAGLRDRVEQVLRSTPTALGREYPDLVTQLGAHGTGHQHSPVCALCTSNVDTLTDALMSVINPQEQP